MSSIKRVVTIFTSCHIGNSSTLLIVTDAEAFIPIEVVGGKPGASSFLANHEPIQAFMGVQKWSGVFLPWANLNTAKFPQVWMDGSM